MANNRYLIVGCGRSGSTLIHLLLKGHPNIVALNDELKVSPFFTKGISTFTFGSDLVRGKTSAFLFYLMLSHQYPQKITLLPTVLNVSVIR